MKTKTEQIEELKATAVKLQKQIEELEKPKQWEPAYAKYIPHTQSEAKALRTYCRLAAYVREYGGDWEADWADLKQNNYYVQYSNHRKKWEAFRQCEICVSGTVHMSRECAEGLVVKLKSGEVVL